MPGFHHNHIVVSLLAERPRPELLMVEVGTAAAEFTVHVLKALAQVQAPPKRGEMVEMWQAIESLGRPPD